jgi:acyl-CoA thioester hydrolase
MIQSETKIRVRYGETDQMGYVYYGVYAQYYEVGRVEAMRMLGFSYKEIEARGILLPVVDYSINYKKPAFYDDELTIITRIKELPEGVKLPFEYECYNASGDLLNTGKVTLVFIQESSNKITHIPDWFFDVLKPHFNQ